MVMIDIQQMGAVLDALPDPVFILSRSGKYVAVFGGSDARYYHDGSGLVGKYF
jgi:two-component system cell cycle response regulator